MADFEYLFIHPLMGTGEAWSGFLVETTSNNGNNAAMQPFLEHGELALFDKRHPWFFPVPPLCDLATNFPEQCVATFTIQTPPGADIEKLRAFEAELRQRKQKIALKAAPSQKLPGAGAWDYLLITTSHARTLPPFTLLGLSSRTTIVATEVQSHADYEWAGSNACALKSMEFLLNRHPPGKKADLTRLKLLELLALIVADADTAKIEDIFRQEPKLAYSLLRLVNSAANAPRSPITTFSQAINLLGRRQLQRWLQLLVFADPNNGQQVNPLLQKAAARGRIIELLAAELMPAEKDANFLDAAFMVGTFSLLDVLLNMPIKEVLQHLPLPEIAHDALADHRGPLGQLLMAMTSTESRDLSAAAQQLQNLSISPAKHLNAQMTALNWATKIHPDN